MIGSFFYVSGHLPDWHSHIIFDIFKMALLYPKRMLKKTGVGTSRMMRTLVIRLVRYYIKSSVFEDKGACSTAKLARPSTRSTMVNDQNPKARSLFRRLAAVVAIFCFIFTVVCCLFMTDGKWLGVVIGLFVGFVMATIAETGYWPSKR
ncbi:MAG: hypothetical protein ACO3GX_03390 [Gemmataceae bacterium]